MELTTKDVLRRAESEGVDLVDLKSVGWRGGWHHRTIAAGRLDADLFERGLSFDGRTPAGWPVGEPSDLVLLPDPASAWVDPFRRIRTLSLAAFVVDPGEQEAHPSCLRSLALRASRHLVRSGIADRALFAPELEFFLFERRPAEAGGGERAIAMDAGPAGAGAVAASAATAKSASDRSAEHPQDLRSEMLLTLRGLGVDVIEHHHGADAGLHGLRLGHAELLRAADNVMNLKYVVRNVARRHGYSATFMPAPLGSMTRPGGMRVDQSLWKGAQTLFFGEGTRASLSQTARWYIGGLLRHTSSLLAFSRPSTNSYRRPGMEPEDWAEPAYARGDRSAAIRIPLDVDQPHSQRVQFRLADGLANPYLTFSAMVMAGLDGIRHQIDPGGPAEGVAAIGEGDGGEDGDGGEEASVAPMRLEDALEALHHDRDYLLAGEVFSDDLINTWIALKAEEIRALRQRPHPHELHLHFDG